MNLFNFGIDLRTDTMDDQLDHKVKVLSDLFIQDAYTIHKDSEDDCLYSFGNSEYIVLYEDERDMYFEQVVEEMLHTLDPNELSSYTCLSPEDIHNLRFLETYKFNVILKKLINDWDKFLDHIKENISYTYFLSPKFNQEIKYTDPDNPFNQKLYIYKHKGFEL